MLPGLARDSRVESVSMGLQRMVAVKKEEGGKCNALGTFEEFG